MTEIIHAPSDTLPGQLQRGRGAGFLAALKRPTSEIHPLLTDCITHDPRLDSQVENRDEFYAALVIQTAMELDGLAKHLRENDDMGQSGWNTPLTVGTLGELARRNYRDARLILRDYIIWGEWWDRALDDLVETCPRETWIDLHTAVGHRLSSEDQLADRISWEDPNQEPWKTWASRNQVIAQIVGYAKREYDLKTAQTPTIDYASMSLSELLQTVNKDNLFKIRDGMAQVVKVTDFEILRKSLNLQNPTASVLALAGLEALASPVAFQCLKGFWEQNVKMPGLLRVRGLSAFLRQPVELMVPLAREWFNRSEEHCQYIAERIIKNHATTTDVPMLRQALSEGLQDDSENCYRICNILEAFQRFPDLGHIPELQQTFCEFRYSYGRERAAKALLMTDPNSFANSFDHECLWDCESGTRELACGVANLSAASARARMNELVEDAFEEADVRTAARNRLPQP